MENKHGGAGQAPVIRKLVIERFRGIENLVWYPEPGVNVILGGGDVGKTTILDAIALLLSPTNSTVLSDADYWCREVDKGFSIEAVMFLPEKCEIGQHAKHAWPWEWDGKEPRLPNLAEEVAGVAEPVYRLRVRGTSEFDLVFEVIQPDSTADHCSVEVRRKIGIVRLGGDDRNDRDLRLVQGSALDRLLSDKALRSRLGQRLAISDVEEEIKDAAKGRLSKLDEVFQQQALPTGLGLGLNCGQGQSLNALVGLTATKDATRLPLASWGAGTRRLAALEIAAANQNETPITLLDEIERGLEPYRQRVFMGKLQKRSTQVFVTTHSAAALSAASAAALWYLDSKSAIGRLPASVVVHQKKDPEMFLARIAIVAEGATEVGFLGSLLERAIGKDLLDRGIWISDGGGNDSSLNLLEGLSDSGLAFAGFADDEGRFAEKWKSVHEKLGNLLFRWPGGCLEENIIKIVPADRLEDFIKDPEGDSGIRMRTLADRLGLTEKDFITVREKSGNITRLIIEAATGSIPEDKKDCERGEKKAFRKHSEKWFKSVEGGRELADKIFTFGLWPKLQNQLLPFLNAIRSAVSLPEIANLP